MKRGFYLYLEKQVYFYHINPVDMVSRMGSGSLTLVNKKNASEARWWAYFFVKFLHLLLRTVCVLCYNIRVNIQEEESDETQNYRIQKC